MLRGPYVYNDVDALDGNFDVDDEDNDEVQGVDWVWYAQPPSSNLAGRVVVTSQWQCISSAPISFALFALALCTVRFLTIGAVEQWCSMEHCWWLTGKVRYFGRSTLFALCTGKSALCTLHFALCSALVAGEWRISHSGDCLHFFWRLKIVGTFWICIFVDGGVEHPALLLLGFVFLFLRFAQNSHSAFHWNRHNIILELVGGKERAR